MSRDYQKIRNAIEEALNRGKKKFVIYPYGECGVLTKQILNDSYGISECYIIDNKLCKFNNNIKSLDVLRENNDQFTVLFTCANPDVYEEVRNNLVPYVSGSAIVDIFSDIREENVQETVYTKCGKYSYGPLCNHWLIEEVGAFCSFAIGTAVVQNHAVNYISTHPFLFCGSPEDNVHPEKYDENVDKKWFFPDVMPKGIAHKLIRSRIGNDVWLGRNVIITNGSNIGNGVIAGAGTIITKDVPDYAVVVGVPARIIRYRYTKEQIKELNAIAWWNWSDEKIRNCFDDFYMDVDEFIAKHAI